MKTAELLLLGVSRLVCLAYLIVAGIAIPEVRRLLSTAAKLIGNTSYIPLVICEPGSVQLEGSTISFDVNDIEGCRTLDLLVNAVALSLIVSMAGVILFASIDAYSRFVSTASSSIVTIPQSAVSGMGLFLVFCLAQSIGVTFALAAECDFWTNYTFRLWEDLGWLQQYGISKVTTHANVALLWTTGVFGCITTFTLVVEAVVFLCFFKDETSSSSSPRTDTIEGPKKSSSLFQLGTKVPDGDETKFAEGSGKPVSSSSTTSVGGPSWSSV